MANSHILLLKPYGSNTCILRYLAILRSIDVRSLYTTFTNGAKRIYYIILYMIFANISDDIDLTERDLCIRITKYFGAWRSW